MAEYEAKWIKLGINIFDDEKIKLIEGMPNVGESIEIVWIKLLCLAGKINDNGYIYFSKMYSEDYNPDINNEGYIRGYTEEQLSILFHKPVDIIRLSIKTFIELEMIIIDRFGVIFLQNFYKYQSIERLNNMKSERAKKVELIQKKVDNGEKISNEEKELLKKEQTRVRVQRFREKQKQEKKNSLMNQVEECDTVTQGENCVTQSNNQDEKLQSSMKSDSNASVTQSVTNKCYNNGKILENTGQDTSNIALQRASPNLLQKTLQQIDIDKDIDKDIDIDLDKDIEKEKEKNEEMKDEEILSSKYEKSDLKAIKEKMTEIIGVTGEEIENECFGYLDILSREVILYAIVITKKANNPCWNYTKKVLESYKSQKLYTLDLLLEYLDKKEKSALSVNRNNKTKGAFMVDEHSVDKWEEIYDN